MPCESARVNGVPTPSRDNDILDSFIDLRDSMRHDRIGSGGREVCAALTATLDRAIVDLVAPLPEGVAIVALGGYGRGELSLFSDVDLMVLHQGGDVSDIASDLFRPLWDAKLRVGHSVRTLREAGSAAKERFETQTTLLTGRLLAGDPGLFDELMAQVAAVTRARPLRRYLVAEERRRRTEAPYPLMAANVKDGRGGLRTLQGFEWERRREELIGRFTGEAIPEEEEAHEALLALRNALHASAGRAHDTFSPDIRQAAARWLGEDAYDAARSLVSANQTVDRLAVSRWPEVIDEPSGPLSRKMWARLTGRPDTLEANRPPTYSELCWILETGDRGRIAFERLWSDGHLDDLLPEWDFVRCEPQLAPFHEHPVDAHLWRTVDEMRDLISDGDRYQMVAEQAGNPAELLMAAFLHDIGKGHGGDHAEVGAGITAAFCERLGLDPETEALLGDAVRHHLLLAETATRRDLDDPSVIDEVSTTLGGPRLLRTVYLLTVADSRATGPTMWSTWKSTLLDTLFDRCLARYESTPPETGRTEDDRVRDLSRSAGFPQDVVEAHLGQMPEDYLRSTRAEDVVWHLGLLRDLTGLSNLGVRQGSPVDTAVVVGRNASGFRQKVAGSFAANGIDVLEARMFTRGDGMIIDSFQVRDDRSGGRVRDERWESARKDLEAAVGGELDTHSKVVARASAYPATADRKPRAECWFDSATGDMVVSIRCADRIGRLAEILDILARSGLEVRLAKLDSRGDELVDTFHVRSDGVTTPDDDLEAIARLIEDSMSA